MTTKLDRLRYHLNAGNTVLWQPDTAESFTSGRIRGGFTKVSGTGLCDLHVWSLDTLNPGDDEVVIDEDTDTRARALWAAGTIATVEGFTVLVPGEALTADIIAEAVRRYILTIADAHALRLVHLVVPLQVPEDKPST